MKTLLVLVLSYLLVADGVWQVRRDITLGAGIPAYPAD